MNWTLASWEISFLNKGIFIVGYVYDHPKFKDGEKVCIKVKAARKFKFLPFYENSLASHYGNKIL